MPYADDSFDAAYLVTVLGEIPDQGAALRELRRVVKPGGRIVVGELFGDPHMVTRKRAGRGRDRGGTAGGASARRQALALHPAAGDLTSRRLLAAPDSDERPP